AFALDLWDRGALAMSLDRDGLIATQANKDALLRTTGGWPLLVDEVFGRCWPRGELRTAITAVEKALSSESDPLRRSFVEGLGIDAAAALPAVIDLVKQDGHIRVDDMEQSVLLEMPVDEFGRAVEFLLRTKVFREEDGYLRVDPVVARLGV